MGVRRIWAPDGTGWTIPPWSSHLNAGICKYCMVREYSGLFGVGRVCNHCKQMGLIYAWEHLEIYNKEKDDLGRGLVVRDKTFYV